MSFPERYDAPGPRCLGSSSAPGCAALRDACLALFPPSENAGTCACRSVRGGSSPSVHSECRAWDAHYDQPRAGQRNPNGDHLANFLVAMHRELGVQCVIWNRRIWSVTKPYWRTYSGVNPHLDHVHVELNWDAARGLTMTMVERAYSQWAGARPPTAKPLPEPRKDEMRYFFWVTGDPNTYWVTDLVFKRKIRGTTDFGYTLPRCIDMGEVHPDWAASLVDVDALAKAV